MSALAKVTPNPPTTGQTVAAGIGVEYLNIRPAGTLAALTVNPPASPVDGQLFTLYIGVTITALTITPLGNQGLDSSITSPTSTAGAGVVVRWLFDSPTQKWLPA
jgi:hypothetical protein